MIIRDAFAWGPTVVVAIGCPAMLFVFGWWSTAALSLSGLYDLPTQWIAASAFTGLTAGIVLDILYLKKWTRNIYDIPLRVPIILYIIWAFILTGFGMGLPLGNLLIGTIAGLYIGRRHTVNPDQRRIRNTPIFTAVITGGMAFPMGILGLHDKYVQQDLSNLLHLSVETLTGPIGIAGICVACIILSIIQFVLTKTAAQWAMQATRY